jgi:hypothetical protein
MPLSIRNIGIPNIRIVSTVVALVAATIVVVGPGSASGGIKATFTAGQAQARQCHQAPTEGRSIDSFRVTAPSTGLLRVRLTPIGGAVGQRVNASDADWDVAVFDRSTGRVVAASTGFHSYELADGFVTAGDKLLVQGCRYSGNARTVNVSTTFVAAPATSASTDPTQVVAVNTPTRIHKAHLSRLDFDLTEAATDTTVDVVLHGQADAKRLSDAGFTYTVKIPNLSDYLAKTRQADAQYAAANTRSDLPSGRTSYRRLADYTYELKNLARKNPGLVKMITLPERSVEGRDIDGIEIATNPNNIADGKPIFFNMGVHHAREWPAGEMPMEWAYDLVTGFGKDFRTTRLVRATRNIVVPIVNPDGFSVSREATPLGDFTAFDYEMKRKNCSPSDAPTDVLRSGLCPQNPAGRTRGVDLNRNYGGFWGGPGASTNWRSDTFRGPAPFSEPEVRAVRELISSRQVTNLITNHTYSNLVLRPPGVLATGQPVDEPVMFKLGEQMADKNGYANIRGWQLYDTTGTTEDWSYWATAGLGYTFEIGGTEFHPTYANGVVAEYLGRAPAAGAGKGGNREAYFAMLEATANSAEHSTVTGQAPPGFTLRVHKQFQTPTSPVIQPDGTVGAPLLYSDVLDSTYRSTGGRFSWAINPSTRPYVAGRYGRTPSGPPQATLSIANPAGQPAENTGDPLAGPHEEVPFTLLGPPDADNGQAHVRIEWASTDTDWDLYIVDQQNHVLAQSAQGGTNFEEAVLIDPPAGQYRAILVNFAQVPGAPFDDWTSPGITFAGPAPAVPGVTEAWTLTCERPNGSVVAARDLTVARGQTVDVGKLCRGPKH